MGRFTTGGGTVGVDVSVACGGEVGTATAVEGTLTGVAVGAAAPEMGASEDLTSSRSGHSGWLRNRSRNHWWAMTGR